MSSNSAHGSVTTRSRSTPGSCGGDISVAHAETGVLTAKNVQWPKRSAVASVRRIFPAAGGAADVEPRRHAGNGLHAPRRIDLESLTVAFDRSAAVRAEQHGLCAKPRSQPG